MFDDVGEALDDLTSWLEEVIMFNDLGHVEDDDVFIIATCETLGKFKDKCSSQ